MNASLVIQQLRTHCPVFSGRVFGAAEWESLKESVNVLLPAAFVIPMGDAPGESLSVNRTRQSLHDTFAVIVILTNTPDERGQAAAYQFDQVRAALWAALIGWRPITPDYDGTIYEGCHLLTLDRARAFYQFEFSAGMEITPADGWQEQDLSALPTLDEMHIHTDVIDPIAHTLPGPDGRIEFETLIDYTED